MKHHFTSLTCQHKWTEHTPCHVQNMTMQANKSIGCYTVLHFMYFIWNSLFATVMFPLRQAWWHYKMVLKANWLERSSLIMIVYLCRRKHISFCLLAHFSDGGKWRCIINYSFWLVRMTNETYLNIIAIVMFLFNKFDEEYAIHSLKRSYWP